MTVRVGSITNDKNVEAPKLWKEQCISKRASPSKPKVSLPNQRNIVNSKEIPTWVVELHKQWDEARGRRIEPNIRNYFRNWEGLLADAGVTSALDRKAARIEAERLESKGYVRLHPQRRRVHVNSLELLPDGAVWLRKLDGKRSAAELLKDSLRIIQIEAARSHPRHPDLWVEWCHRLVTAFAAGKSIRPLKWNSPVTVQLLLRITYEITARDWGAGALVRNISKGIKLDSVDSKYLEKHQGTINACLTQFFVQPTTLESMGVELTDSRASVSGILELDFHDGKIQIINELEAPYAISLHDLERTKSVTTYATRLLTVENTKTTLRDLATRNVAAGTLLAACSFPSRALLRLIELLPLEMPIYHFGDTDPAGLLILSRLRAATGREVRPFLMDRREAREFVPLGKRDLSLLPGLLADPHLKDFREAIKQFSATGCKGDFEQESLGRPDLENWPFYSRLMETR